MCSRPVPDIDLANVSVDPIRCAAGGVVFDVPPATGNFPKVVGGVYMPAGFDQTLADEAIWNSGHPRVDVPISGPAPKLTITPPATLPAATYDLVVIGLYDA